MTRAIFLSGRGLEVPGSARDAHPDTGPRQNQRPSGSEVAGGRNRAAPSRRLRLRHQGRRGIPAGRRREAADPAGAIGSCLDPLPVLRQVLGAGSGALPGEAADHGSQHLGDRGGVDLQRVRRPTGAAPRRRAPGNSRAPLLVGLVVSHPTVGPGPVSGRPPARQHYGSHPGAGLTVHTRWCGTLTARTNVANIGTMRGSFDRKRS